MLARRLAAVATACVVSATSAGCITGERPTLAESPQTTGDPAIDAVLARLDAVSSAVFSADYEVLTRFGGLTTTAEVVQDGAARRSVTIGQVRFLVDGRSTATCDLAERTCSGTIDAARVSDTQLTPDFYAMSAAARLRRDAAARAGPTVAGTETIAGQPASCVIVPLGGAQSRYCALDAGPLAVLDAADVLIQLTSWSPTADPAAFQRPD